MRQLKDEKGRFAKGHKHYLNSFGKGDKHTDKTKRKMSENNAHYWKGKNISQKTKDKISNTLKGRVSPMKGRKHKKETIEQIKRSNLGQKRSDETKKRCRISKIKYLERCKTLGQPLTPTIGKNETQILDELAKKIGYKIIRQFLVNGYFTDRYIPELNLVVEVDEIPKIRERDIRREREIKQKLNCSFLRIMDY